METVEHELDDVVMVVSPDFAVQLSFKTGHDHEDVPENVQVVAGLAMLMHDEQFRAEILRRAYPKEN